MTGWRHGLPAAEAAEHVEVWQKIGLDNWYQFIGVTSMYENEVIIRVADMEHQEFHNGPPCQTEAKIVWRVI